MITRYARQELFDGIGPEGQARIRRSRVVVVGCGALGTHAANSLARAGVGTIVLIDRDLVDLTNLQRQVLFDEDDARAGLPKAVAAADKLSSANSECRIEPIVVDFAPWNAERFIASADLVIDGTDNFETRYLLNDACVKLGKPWVYAGVIASYGMTFPFLPGRGPCFRCAFPEPPPAGMAPTCDTVGIIEPVVSVIAGVQCAEALKILSGGMDRVRTTLLHVDLWTSKLLEVKLGARDPACPACGQGKYDFLEARRGVRATTLCGGHAVQISSREEQRVDLAALARSWQHIGPVVERPYMVRLTVEEHELTVFEDGRAIVKGTGDEARARTLHARYVGI